MSTIKGVTVKKDDIIKIKFKSFDELVKLAQDNGMCFTNFLDQSQLDTSVKAVLSGGYFKVTDVESEPNEFIIPKMYNEDVECEVTIDNYLDGDMTFINEHVIEEISVENDAHSSLFVKDMNLSVVNVGSQLYINGVALSMEKHKKLIEVLESAISDIAIQSMLSE